MGGQMESVKLNPARIRSMHFNSGGLVLRIVAIFGIVYLLSAGDGFSQPSVRGQVIDSITENPVPDAHISLYDGTQVLAKTNSDYDGNYSLVIDVEEKLEKKPLKLVIEDIEFVKFSQNIEIVSGRATKPFYRVSLLPKELAKCRKPKGHCVIVGYFNAPLSASYSNLSIRIAYALTYNLLTLLQKYHIDPVLQPTFLACDEAKPRAIDLGENFARVLKADAFLFGDVQQAMPGYDIRTYVSEPYDIFSIPPSSTNPKVNLEDSGAAELNKATHAAILTAIAGGYEREGRFAEGIETTIAAERILGRLTTEAKEIRERCKRNIPHHKLLHEGSP